jgi:serine phosphatase RsbU (regulator of sigma subunit)
MHTSLFKNIVLLCSFLLLGITSSKAQNTVYIFGADKSVVLDTLWLFEDTNQLTFEQVREKEFLPSTKKNFGITPSVYWAKLKLNVSTKTPVFLELNYPVLDSVTFFYKENGSWKEEYTGDKREIKEINYKHYQPLLLLKQTESTEPTEIFIRIVSEGKLTIPLQIQTLEELVWSNLIYNVITGGYYGICLVMMLYNLVLWIFLKDRAYLAYVFLLLGAILYSGNLFGHGYLFIHGNVSWLDHSLASQGLAIYYVFVYTFTRFFLSLEKVNKKLDKALFFMSILGGLFIPATFIFSYASVAKISVLFNILTQFLIIGVCIYTWRKGVKATRIFLLAWSCFFVGVVLNSLSISGVLPDNIFVRNSGEAGFILQIVLFSIALSDRYRIFKKERESMQEELLEIQKGQSEKLEVLVIERTQEITQKQEEILTQNEELHQQQEEIMAQRDFIEDKNKELQKTYSKMEEQNRFITDSIRYAKDIQSALLPKTSRLEKVFDEHFILFKPRDIVSGDFYWYGEIEGKQIFAVGDCTGHGVPGAFMSMIGNDLLTHAVIEAQVSDPAKILERLHKGVRYALKQEQKDNSDGMEVAIVVIDKEKKQVAYAGAKVPLIYIQNGTVHKIRGNTKAIGGKQKEEKREFTTHFISIEETTNFYMFSDGYQDQFGENQTDRKRFQSNYLIELLEENHKSAFQKQKEVLETTLKEWQGNLDQLDDIIVVGLKV